MPPETAPLCVNSLSSKYFSALAAQEHRLGQSLNHYMATIDHYMEQFTSQYNLLDQKTARLAIRREKHIKKYAELRRARAPSEELISKRSYVRRLARELKDITIQREQVKYLMFHATGKKGNISMLAELSSASNKTYECRSVMYSSLEAHLTFAQTLQAQGFGQESENLESTDIMARVFALARQFRKTSTRKDSENLARRSYNKMDNIKRRLGKLIEEEFRKFERLVLHGA